MPHVRNRYLSEIIKKRLSFFPVLGIQGARQVGKSSLIRDLMPSSMSGLHYETFDQRSVYEFALNNPEAFIAAKTPDDGTLAIDEAQKVPQIFDAVKYSVDQNRVPGKYILLGSTEFSKRTLIREPLTGRMAMLRLYPFTVGECLSLKFEGSNSALTIKDKPRITRTELMKHLPNGGMPGAFHIRDDETKNIFFKEWIGLVIMRDLALIPRIKVDPIIADAILEKIAQLEEPTAGHIAKALKIDLRRIKTHLDCLETLFVVHKIMPHPLGSGQPMYLHCDVGLANYLGACFEKRLYTWVYQELLAHSQLHSNVHEKIYFYRSLKGSIIHFVVEDRKQVAAIKLIAKESPTLLDFKGLQGFHKKKATDKRSWCMIALGPTTRYFKEENIKMYPWESIG